MIKQYILTFIMAALLGVNAAFLVTELSQSGWTACATCDAVCVGLSFIGVSLMTVLNNHDINKKNSNPASTV